MKKSNLLFNGIHPFELTATYNDKKPGKSDFQNHIHSECEIYVNVSGKVSFQVEDTIYPISSGNIIITRPGEYHHCIYTDALEEHKHFWILIDSNGNDEILDIFYNREKGKNNLFSPNPNDIEALFDICMKLSDTPSSATQEYILFFELLNLISNANNGQAYNAPPDDVSIALEYISTHLSESLCVEALAKLAYVSVNTLERHFRESIGLSPTAYINERRLFAAAHLLQNGYGVQQASDECGFCSCSYFIYLFKKKYGITPLKYAKNPKHNKPT